MALLIIFTILLIIIAFFLLSQFFNILFRGYAPFISTESEVIEKIINEIKIDSDPVFYELGCGKASFLRALGRKFPQAKLIGVEYSILPWLVAKIQTSMNKSKIKIIKENIFKINLADADYVYCYLNIAMMKKLEEKFKNECKPGAKIISYSFAMPNLKPEKVIPADGSSIYFYTL
ncbi:MAG: class I SAM-dependent methyltransferase [bacterium]|nr:class I SAM-dependent methyltransferase [bacterium]